ncbi:MULTISPECIES: PD-(D/E)XK nuclease family protein [Candidatus Cardinium]|uniref:PD-(D/E)XK nuclease family protein n=1 Tax=Candidatus Cardinium TaxID=273135 RepID=UPI001FAA7832|nr:MULTISPECIES: PD-(D/E)XK nuclease family protein [Cardinium]
MKTKQHPPFVAAVVNHLNQGDSLGKRLIVFPTQLSIDYFNLFLDKKKWQDCVTCLTLHQFILTHSSLKLLPNIALLSKLHCLAEQILNRKESFEQFCSWGISLLEDFSSIDTYLVNSASLFASLLQQKKLNNNSFVEKTLLASLKKSRTLSLDQPMEALFFCQQLPMLYEAFREKLIEKGEGYEGLCYQAAQPCPEIMATYQELIFVGFNLLTPVEERFIRQCHLLALTTFFWDVDTHYLDNEINLAGHYLRQHREKKWVENSFSKLTYLNDPHKKVSLIEASSIVAQVEAIVVALQTKTDDGQPKFLPGQTAIVVSGSQLLIPLLDRLSNLPIPLHARLDYPFSATVIYSLVVRLVQLWEASMATPVQPEIASHLADVLALCYPFLQEKSQLEITAMRPLLQKDGSNGTLYQGGFELFDLWLNKGRKGLLPYLTEGLTYLYDHFVETHSLFLEVNKSALSYLLEYIEGLVAEMIACSIPFFLSGLKGSKILLHKDNPLLGLYIVDVADSYNLDFEHVFFLNMNEGHFPKPTHRDSFLPYDLRASFGLPVDKVVENKVAYGFYRLLQRAQNICAYYTQKNHLDSSNEMSRLLIQLTFDSQLNITTSHHAINPLPSAKTAIVIEKDHGVMQLLSKFLVHEGATASSLTPSALITYLSCPLQFYFKYLLQLKQTRLPRDESEALQLGTLLHHIMASLYQPFVGKQLDKKGITQLKSKIQTGIDQAISRQKTSLSSPMLLYALLEKLLARLLDLDHAGTPFTLLGIEVAIKHPIVLDGGSIQRRIWLSGVIDRIDRPNNFIRIIDYKTGLVNNKIEHIVTLFDRTKIKKNKAIFQLFFYTWLFKTQYRSDVSQPIMPYLIPIRELFGEDYRPGILIHKLDDGKNYQCIKDIMPYAALFEEGLSTLLSEIFNPAVPFVQTEDYAICSYCPYVRICQRD